MKYFILASLCLCLLQPSAQAADSATLSASDTEQLQKLAESLILSENIQVLSDQVVNTTSESVTRHIVLDVPSIPGLGPIEFKKRDPLQRGFTRFPTAVILAGVQTGMESVALVPDTPNSSLVALDYPVSGTSKLDKVLNVIENLWKIQAHMLVTFAWLSQQWDVESSRLSSVNISFGTFVAPLPLRILQQMGFQPHATVFAFGGGTVMPFVDQVLRSEVGDENLRNGIRQLLLPFIRLIEPKQHLKKLKGSFLVVRATEDQVIPKESTNTLVESLIGSVEVIDIPGPHIDPSQPQIILKAAKKIFDWIHGQR